LPDSIPLQTIIVSYVSLLLSLSVHECAHATSAYWLEDDTAKRMGRMTLNPLAHMDVLGTLVMPLLGMFTGWRVLGWAKPVPVNPSNLSRRFSMRGGMALVAGAGPASNVLLALVCIPVLALAVRAYLSDLQGIGLSDDLPQVKMNVFMLAMYSPVEKLFDLPGITEGMAYLLAFLGRMISINMGLAIFNLLPFGPLDGASILRGFLPSPLLPAFDRVQPVLTIAILMLFFLGGIRYVLFPFFWAMDQFFLNPLARLFLS
jgi:Zn-dependent protease